MKKLFWLLLLLLPVMGRGQVITTVAGTVGVWGYSGDNGSATAALLWNPKCARPDALGNIYVADVDNHVIRKINSYGIITTVAGNGSYSHSGDGGQATAAGISDPISVVIDLAGNLYIDEDSSGTNGPWIRKVNPAGIITTIAGSIHGYSGDNGPATAARFQFICDITIDGAGNIYIADCFNNCIRKISTAGIITTIAGNGTIGYSGDGFAATDAQFNQPNGIAVDNTGSIYISDLYNSRIRKVNTTGIINTVAGNGTFGYGGDSGPATAAELKQPFGVAVDAIGNVYISDAPTHRIRKVDLTNTITTIAGNGTQGNSGDGSPATAAQLWQPYGISVDGSGNIYITEPNMDYVRRVSANNTEVNNLCLFLEEISIHPNPATTALTISAPGKIKEVRVYNVTGRAVRNITSPSERPGEVDISALPAGVYFVRVTDEDGGVVVRRFVKE